eukprot:1186347-Prorocentrum_minimum.AAC.2
MVHPICGSRSWSFVLLPTFRVGITTYFHMPHASVHVFGEVLTPGKHSAHLRYATPMNEVKLGNILNFEAESP